MAIQAHLVELERKHKILENELHEALVHLSTDDLQIVELKRRKLMVIESEVSFNRGSFRMAIQAHLVELERKHKVLENELHEALVHLSTDDLQIVELKRRKLMVKDAIERLRQSADETVH